MINKSRIIGISIAAGIAVAALTGCKATEPFNDAPVGQQNKTPADVLSFPDGFSNVASKCDGPNRVYVAFHGDAAYGSVSVIADDPRCKGPAR